jgi:putative transposase
MLQDVLKKALKPVQRRHATQHLLDAYHISARRAYQVIGSQRSSWFYKAHGRDDTELRHRLRELVQ